MAQWSGAFIDSLPDSAFLWVEPGGKTVNGRTTPLSLRHLPYRGSDGKVDREHAMNALARLPQVKGLDAERVTSLQTKLRHELGIEEPAKSDRADGRVMRFDMSPMTATREGPSGGLIVRGNIRRTGVLEYRMPDGSIRRELCHPDHVFSKASRESFKGAPITIDHPGKVTPKNWKDHAVGHVGDTPVQDGRFLASELHIMDSAAIGGVKSGKHKEISCGYTCGLDHTPGVYNGEKYDAIQTNPIGNHVALGPAGWGRAGSEVRIHMDGVSGDYGVAGWGETEAHSDAPSFVGMTPEEKAAFEKAMADLKAANEAIAKLTQDAAESAASAEAARKALETASAEKRLLETQASRVDQAKAEAESQARQDAAVAELIGLIEAARKVFATAKDPTGAKWKADGKKADDIRREILKHLEPDFSLTNADGTPTSSETLAALCRQAISVKTRVDSANNTLMVAAAGARVDGRKRDDEPGDDDEPMADAEKARKDMIKRMKDRWTPPGKKDRRNARDGQGAGR